METAQSLEKKVRSECEQLLREGKTFELATLRMLISAFQTKQIEKRGKGVGAELTDEDILEIIIREVKKRKESAKAFRDGNRDDLADKEDAERVLLEKYLPPQASDEEIDEVVSKACEIVCPKSEKDMGKVMGEAMKSLKGRADAGAISAKIRTYIASHS